MKPNLNIKSVLKILASLILVVSVFGYSFMEAEGIIQGPQITIHTPMHGASVSSALVSIEGESHNSTHITLNDRKIYLNEEGVFSEELLLFEGNNTISIKAKDRFDKEVEKVLEVVYNAPQILEIDTDIQ